MGQTPVMSLQFLGAEVCWLMETDWMKWGRGTGVLTADSGGRPVWERKWRQSWWVSSGGQWPWVWWVLPDSDRWAGVMLISRMSRDDEWWARQCLADVLLAEQNKSSGSCCWRNYSTDGVGVGWSMVVTEVVLQPKKCRTVEVRLRDMCRRSNKINHDERSDGGMSQTLCFRDTVYV